MRERIPSETSYIHKETVESILKLLEGKTINQINEILIEVRVSAEDTATLPRR